MPVARVMDLDDEDEKVFAFEDFPESKAAAVNPKPSAKELSVARVMDLDDEDEKVFAFEDFPESKAAAVNPKPAAKKLVQKTISKEEKKAIKRQRYQKELLKQLNQTFAQLKVCFGGELEVARKATVDSYKMVLDGLRKGIMAQTDPESCRAVPGFDSLLKDAPIDTDVEFTHFLGASMYYAENPVIRSLARSVTWLSCMSQVPIDLLSTVKKCEKCKLEALNVASEITP